MKRLARRWKNVSSDGEDDGVDNFSLPTSSDFHPMDTQEQEELVRSLERSQAQQSRFWRGVFAGLLCCFMAFLIFSIHGQTTMPWELRYHAYFMEEIESWIVIAADWAGVFVCLMAIAGLLHWSQSHRQWLWFSCYSGVLLAVFWLYNMLKLAQFRWDAIWLPLGPLCGAGFGLYVDNLMNESSEEVRKLEATCTLTRPVDFSILHQRQVSDRDLSNLFDQKLNFIWRCKDFASRFEDARNFVH